jgi:putative methionine-R-sulfoxide reductase with GAF domain
MKPSATQPSLIEEIEARLAKTGTTDSALLEVLDQVLTHFACTAGTIHGLNSQSLMLGLRARRNIPDRLLPRIQQIPVGKGMAGLAVERRQPVQVCNLQTDNSGVAKPAAKETGMEGSIALPIFREDQVVGVLGVAKPTVYQFTDPEIALLIEISKVIGKFLKANDHG